MIYPMFFMVLLTFALGIYALGTRVRSLKSGAVKMQDFVLMTADFPEDVIKATRCFNNQFELPVLFYIAALAHIVVDSQSQIAMIFAWSFVVIRIAHAGIHLCCNILALRGLAFWLSFFAVIALWLDLILSI